MADVVLTVENVSKAGLAAAYTTLNATDTYYVDGALDIILHFLNTGGSPSTVTFDITQTVEGETVNDPTLNVPATTGDVFTGGRGSLFKVVGGAQDGRLKFSQDQATGVTVAVLRR